MYLQLLRDNNSPSWSPAVPTQPSNAISWQPLQTPRLKVSLRLQNSSNCRRMHSLKRIAAAHPEVNQEVHKTKNMYAKIYLVT